jgi:plasmid stabilization system protein ParE
MDGLKIFWTKTAISQRNHIFDYWNNRNKSISYSKQLNLMIKERTELLKVQLKLGKETDFKDTRIISLGHFSILYQIHPPKIIITAFWDNRQNPDKLLDFLRQNQ